MTNPIVRVRIAPSPTGDPHVGTAYMALFNLAFARQQGGQFILRIEDTDRQRYVDTSEQQIYDSLRWLGFEWDEGPDKGGPYGPYRQSERLPIYRKYAEQLVAAGHAYYCWCSRERLAQMRAEQEASGQKDQRYDRFCVGKTREQRAGEPGFTDRPVIRMLIPENPTLSFHDLVRGDTRAPFPDDQVILKSDGFPTYHLAVVVDDHEMEITHITRGEEWISSTPKQLLLYEWLGWDAPRWAHFPLLRNLDRSKISKRKNPAARMTWFMEQGYLPEALINFLALMGYSMPDGREVFSFDDLSRSFAWERLSPVGPIFELDKLDWLNGQYVRALSDDEFLRRLRPFLPPMNAATEAGLRRLLPLIKERTVRLVQVREQVNFLFATDLAVDPALLLTQEMDRAAATAALRAVEDVLAETEQFEPHPLEGALDAVRERLGLKRRALFMLVRVALTGKTATPPLFDVMAALGRERCHGAVESAIRQLAAGEPAGQ
jgi:glutamyl-tRNA synthetase